MVFCAPCRVPHHTQCTIPHGTCMYHDRAFATLLALYLPTAILTYCTLQHTSTRDRGGRTDTRSISIASCLHLCPLSPLNAYARTHRIHGTAQCSTISCVCCLPSHVYMYVRSMARGLRSKYDQIYTNSAQTQYKIQGYIRHHRHQSQYNTLTYSV
jgi:hypothetical protein